MAKVSQEEINERLAENEVEIDELFAEIERETRNIPLERYSGIVQWIARRWAANYAETGEHTTANLGEAYLQRTAEELAELELQAERRAAEREVE